MYKRGSNPQSTCSFTDQLEAVLSASVTRTKRPIQAQEQAQQQQQQQQQLQQHQVGYQLIKHKRNPRASAIKAATTSANLASRSKPTQQSSATPQNRSQQASKQADGDEPHYNKD
jgi:hypothetical protein